MTLVDVLVAESTGVQEEKDFSLLYQAIETLTPRQQEIVKRHYGIDCAPEDLFTLSCDILRERGKPSKRGASAAYSTHKHALSNLHKKLTTPMLLEETFSCGECGKAIARYGASQRKRYCSQSCLLRASRKRRAQQAQAV